MSKSVFIVVASLIAVAFIALIGYINFGWFGARENVSECQCTKTKGQCGRDQYCDGCNCVSENNVTRTIQYQFTGEMPSNPSYGPGVPSGNGGGPDINV